MMRKTSSAFRRLASLDGFRGITIAGMILVNNPGSGEHVYPPLRHAVWHGWTPTDLVFPFFLFIVGVSISLALSQRIDAGISGTALHFKIIKRSIILFALGLLLCLIPRFDFATMRIPGVLQRIALCYLFAALLYIHSGPKTRIAAVLFALGSYWAVMKFVPVPGFGAGVLDYNGNLCGYIDTKLLAAHLYKPEFDPEGILSTLPAIATSLLGTLAGDWLCKSRGVLEKTAGLFAAGIGLTALGLALHPYFPINKQLWTSTFVLFTAGAALLLLALFFLVIDGFGFKKWATPFFIFGMNAIAAYCGSILGNKLLVLTKANLYIYDHLLVPWAGKMNGSLIYAVGYVLIWLGIMTPFYKKKIFIKI